MPFELCFYVPGELSIIDPDRGDGRGLYSGKTLEELRSEYPGAVSGRFDEWCAAKAAIQDRPVNWHEITEERFEELLGCLPPAAFGRGGFLVGEPWDHHATSGKPRFQACVKRGTKCYASARAVTRDEFRTIELPPLAD
jgi:hypothetical protein